MALADYLKFIRFKYHVTFLSAAAGALLFANSINPALLVKLALLYVSFNVLLYGGLYTINDIADARSDARHPQKRKRPLPSGNVSLKSALLFSIALLAAGLVGGITFFHRNVFYIFLAIIAINLFYTFIAKKVPYAELVANTVTHPLRFLMGIFLVRNEVPYLLILAIALLFFGLACVRRIVEMDVQGWEERKVLKSYSQGKLFFLQVMSFLAIIPLAIIDRSAPSLIYPLIIAAYIILVFGIYLSKSIRGLFRAVWTR
ncbi:UbiA family prenyltransferase [Candidatus Woesearchaeota archaeon]|nr:UbiA family prenyltransferase [Candidatus Woesearchaeota archaeon]